MPYYGYLELNGWPLLSGLVADHKFLAVVAMATMLAVFVPFFEYLLRKVARRFCPQVQFIPLSSLLG
ncbi:MAG: hypothetical protein A3K06_03555 [Candidatus Doudnabacteria bacterium RIFCSPHIGHO2_01_52_17]|uniref:Uncharacterized protein n=1 Tax=Candidatus Doudnabacteria bacterium RIFCSPHIGHO2_01_52_17 TaxID=1817820 RepID=A0A1F5NBZ7_9BACT|nr:MAG: hypothetical protein A3K06_03555 [Candidatus Doudnabacteria bacterium RIFCSPHIGHO2_01_52_17]